MTTLASQINRKFSEIILIDDDSIFIMLNKHLLRNIGFEKNIRAFNNGNDAFNHIRVAKIYSETEERPEGLNILIFLDLNMPTMDGWEFIDCFKCLAESRKREFQIIILSSSCHQSEISRAMSFNEVFHYIVKPLTSTSIVEVLNVLNKKKEIRLIS